MIYYSVQTHGTGASVGEIVSLLSSPSDAMFGIGVDATDDEFQRIKDNTASRTQSRIHFWQTPPITWGGGSITQEMLHAVDLALEFPDWEWFCNISGSCLPLRSAAETELHLNARRAADGTLAHCYWFSPHPLMDPLPFKEFSPEASIKMYNRVEFISDLEVIELFRSGELDPARNAKQRRMLEYRELSRGVFEVRRRSEPAPRFSEKAYVGRQWVVLHRSVAETLSGNPIVEAWLNEAKTTFISDECFFQELLLSDEMGFSKVTAKANLHYHGGGPQSLGLETLKEAYDSGAFFVRKLEDRNRQEILSALRVLKDSASAAQSSD